VVRTTMTTASMNVPIIPTVFKYSPQKGLDALYLIAHVISIVLLFLHEF
jgi:hypothetical protein